MDVVGELHATRQAPEQPMATFEQRRAQTNLQQGQQGPAGQPESVAPSAPPAPQQLVATA